MGRAWRIEDVFAYVLIENWEFRSFLKGYDIEIEELDSIVHRLFVQGSEGHPITLAKNGT